MERKKFTTTLKHKTFLGLDIIKSINEIPNKNEVIEYLVDEYLRDNNLEEIINDMLKKNNEQK